MLVAFFGDTHGHINTMYSHAMVWQQRTGLTLDLIVQVGDFGFWLSEETVDVMTAKHGERSNEELKSQGMATTAICGDYPSYVLGEKKVPIPTLVIRGNHEDQEYLMGLERQLEQQHPEDYLTRAIEVVPGMFYLPDGHVVSRNGIKFGGLGGNFSIKTWENWDYWHEARHKPGRYGEKRRLNHFTRDRAEALRRETIDVLLFHDAPTRMGLVGSTTFTPPPDEATGIIYRQMGCPFLTELIEDIKPRYVFCGHWHQYRKEGFNRNKHGFPDTQVVVLNQTATPPSHDCMEVIEL